MKTYLIEMKETRSKIQEEIHKSLKENQEKANKQVKETIQVFKTKIKTIKNTQTEGILETDYEKMNHKYKHKQQIQEMEERISSTEETIE